MKQRLRSKSPRKARQRGRKPALFFSGTCNNGASSKQKGQKPQKALGEESSVNTCKPRDMGVSDEQMAKNPANMTHAERMAALSRDLSSPACVAEADKILELIGHEYLDVLGIREMAARRHRTNSPPPAFPTAPGSAAPAEKEAMTVEQLADSYVETSAFRDLTHGTKVHYSVLLKRIKEDFGRKKLTELDKSDLYALYDQWSSGGATSMANSLLTMIRMLFNFGASALEDDECERLFGIIRKMKRHRVNVRTERLTKDQVIAIRTYARTHSADRSPRRQSLALAQALQFDLGLHQKDVIGEWLPLTEDAPPTDIISGNEKWVRGLRWEEIDDNFVLRRLGSAGREITFDLKNAQMVMEELRLSYWLGPTDRLDRNRIPTSGPMIVNEQTGLPWGDDNFRATWRKIARACDIPDNVRNMDSRPRAALEDGEDEEDNRPAEAELLSAGHV